MASISNTYARAFADAVFDGRLDPAKTLQEAQALAGLVRESKDLKDVWAAPSILTEQKRAVLDAIVARQGISQVVRNFMAVVIDHGRVHFLAEIVRQFEQELNERLGFAEAQITTARELDEAERRVIEQEIAKLTGKKVRARYARDPLLIGGALVRVGSTIYDGSVNGQLERIREALGS